MPAYKTLLNGRFTLSPLVYLFSRCAEIDSLRRETAAGRLILTMLVLSSLIDWESAWITSLFSSLLFYEVTKIVLRENDVLSVSA
jgi:hypothetical protein